MHRAPKIRVTSFALGQRVCVTRLPFRFGAVTMERAPSLCLRTAVVVDGGRDEAVGHAEDLLVPRWFDKDPGKTVEEDQAALVDAARRAATAALALPAGTVAEVAEAVTAAVHAGTAPLAPQRLRLGFGAALLERAVLDAVARAHQASFFAGLHAGLFGVAPEVTAALPRAPAETVVVRHTVGMQDPLDGDRADGLSDGLPRTLVDAIRAYGLRAFKVKIGAGRKADHDRLLAVHRVLAAEAPANWRCTLDANEQYADLDALEGLLDDLAATPAGRDLAARVLHLEQPLPRHATFDPAHAGALQRIARHVPLLIDEADVDAGAFAAARAVGFQGVSMKSCKGVLRAVAQHAECAALRAQGIAAFQSAEDLTTLPVLALHQDLATVQALGLPHVERNGHHYFRGLDHLPPAEAAAAVRAHGDLYRPLGNGHALAITDGRLRLGSLTCAGFGYGGPVDFAARAPVDG